MSSFYLNRSWHWLDYSVVFLRLCWYIMNLFIIVSTPYFGLPEQYWMVLLFTASYVIPQLFHRSNKISSIGFILSELILTGSAFVWITNYSTYVIDFMWIPILSIAFLSAQRTQWWALAGFVLLPVCILAVGELTKELFIQYILALVLFGTMGLSFRFLLQKNEEQKALLKELNIKHQQLIQLTDEIEYLTLKEERNRIARELHDAIGHTFTTAIVGIDAIAILIDSQPAAAKEQAKEVSAYVREGLEEIRRYVHALPLKEEIPIVFALEKVIKAFSHSTGITVSFQLEGDELHIFNKKYTIALIRCLQESLTNALKHGHATSISVTLCNDGEVLMLRVEDNGTGEENLVFGFGLTTMEQRIQEIGGIFWIDSNKQRGTIIELQLPIGGSVVHG